MDKVEMYNGGREGDLTGVLNRELDNSSLKFYLTEFAGAKNIMDLRFGLMMEKRHPERQASMILEARKNAERLKPCLRPEIQQALDDYLAQNGEENGSSGEFKKLAHKICCDQDVPLDDLVLPMRLVLFEFSPTENYDDCYTCLRIAPDYTVGSHISIVGGFVDELMQLPSYKFKMEQDTGHGTVRLAKPGSIPFAFAKGGAHATIDYKERTIILHGESKALGIGVHCSSEYLTAEEKAQYISEDPFVTNPLANKVCFLSEARQLLREYLTEQGLDWKVEFDLKR